MEHIYESLLALYKKFDDIGLKGRILQCLGKPRFYFSFMDFSPPGRLFVPSATHPDDAGSVYFHHG